jgi:hypothetical protein
MQRALFACETLTDYLGVLVDENGHSDALNEFDGLLGGGNGFLRRVVEVRGGSERQTASV